MSNQDYGTTNGITDQPKDVEKLPGSGPLQSFAISEPYNNGNGGRPANGTFLRRKLFFYKFIFSNLFFWLLLLAFNSAGAGNSSSDSTPLRLGPGHHRSGAGRCCGSENQKLNIIIVSMVVFAVAVTVALIIDASTRKFWRACRSPKAN